VKAFLSNKRKSFFRQGVLILLPLAILVSVGVFSLRQERILAETEAKENCAQIAESLAASLSRDLSSIMPLRVIDIYHGATASSEKPHAPSVAPFWNSKYKTESTIAAPLFDQLIQTWADDNYIAMGSMVIDKEGSIYGWDGKLKTYRRIPSSTIPSIQPLDKAQLTGDQSELWQQARDLEYQSTNGVKAAQAYARFLSLSPPQNFADQAEYTLALLEIKLGSNVTQRLERLSNRTTAITESGLPINVLAQWQQILLEKAPSDEKLGILYTNVLNYPSLATPVILDSIEKKVASHAGTSQAALTRLSWKTQEAYRQFLQNKRNALLTNSTTPRIFWTDWRKQNWLVTMTALDSNSPNALIQVDGKHEPFVSEMVWEILIKSRTPPPDYAGISVEIAGKTVFSQNASGKILASASGKWPNSTDLKSLTVNLHLASPKLLYARQQQHTLIIALLVFVSALTAVIGLYMAAKAFNEQIRLGELKSNFVSAVSHELRAPIASVRLLAEGLHRGKITGAQKQQEYYQFIVQECRRLSSLIENVLDFSRIEQGRKKYQFEPADIHALVSQTVQLLTPNAQEHGVALTLDISKLPPEKANFNCDSLAIQQALINLIDNALKHSPNGTTVTVGAAADGQSNSLTLWVQDQGPGIPASEQEKIFEQFYRLGSELRRETQGIGIGLTIVKHIVEGHGGRIIVHSAPGHGSRFTMEFKNDAPHPPQNN